MATRLHLTLLYSALETINRAWTNRCTFAADGNVAQDDTELMTFMGRSLLALNNYILNQLPPGIKPQINGDEMMHAISFEKRDRRLALGPWIDGPGWRREGASRDVPQFVEIEDDQVNQNDRRRAMLKNWDAFATRMGRHIPRAVHFKKVTPAPEQEEDMDMDDTIIIPTVPAHFGGIDSEWMDDNEEAEDHNMTQFKNSNGLGGRPWSEYIINMLE